MRVWRTFNIRPGRFLSYRYLEVVPQSETGLKVLKIFSPRSTNHGSVSHTPTPRGKIFSCCESTCVLTFKTQREAEVPMDAGKHVRATDCESVYDTARKKWASRVTEVHVATGETQLIGFEEAGPSRTMECRSKGSTLETTKRAPRMEEKVKIFFIQKFNQGAAVGQKADPVQVAREMNCVRNCSGKLHFKPEEWRTSQQIKNFFLRMSALQRQRLPDENQEEEFADEYLEDLQSEDSTQAIRQEEHKDMESPEHPIQVGAENLCALLHAGKLSSLRLAQLRETCTALKLQKAGSYSTKRTYTEPLILIPMLSLAHVRNKHVKCV